VTPLNVHDLARAARTYAVAPLYVVTPLLSQQALVNRILDHYRKGYGLGANPSRAEALRDVCSSINEALTTCAAARAATRRRRDGGAGAKSIAARLGAGWREPGLAALRHRVWASTRRQCDHFLGRCAAGEFNHLLVRSAVAVIFDRLFEMT
jgi:hypothetical protein